MKAQEEEGSSGKTELAIHRLRDKRIKCINLEATSDPSLFLKPNISGPISSTCRTVWTVHSFPSPLLLIWAGYQVSGLESLTCLSWSFCFLSYYSTTYSPYDSQSPFQNLNKSWPGSSVGQNIVPICQSCWFDPWSGHTGINQWYISGTTNRRFYVFLSFSLSLSFKKHFFKLYIEPYNAFLCIVDWNGPTSQVIHPDLPLQSFPPPLSTWLTTV